jgi:hypothetical protein
MEANLRIAKKTPLARFESKSRPGTFYGTYLGADGNVYCDCPAWRFCHNHPHNRSCEHTRETLRRLTHGGVTLSAQGAVPCAPMVRPTRKPTAKPVEAETLPLPLPRTFWERL